MSVLCYFIFILFFILYNFDTLASQGGVTDKKKSIKTISHTVLLRWSVLGRECREFLFKNDTTSSFQEDQPHDDVRWTDLGQLGRGEDEGHGELSTSWLPPLPPAPRDPGPLEREELPLLGQRRPRGRKRRTYCISDIASWKGVNSHTALSYQFVTCNSIRNFFQVSDSELLKTSSRNNFHHRSQSQTCPWSCPLID